MVLPTRTLLGLLFGLVTAFGLTACAGDGASSREGGAVLAALVAPPAGQARIFFYRSEEPFMFGLEPKVVVNGKAIGRAVLGEAFFRDAKPGPYRITISSDPETILKVFAEAGDTIFIKIDVDFSITGSRLTVSRVNEEQGRAEVENSTLRLRAPGTS